MLSIFNYFNIYVLYNRTDFFVVFICKEYNGAHWVSLPLTAQVITRSINSYYELLRAVWPSIELAFQNGLRLTVDFFRESWPTVDSQGFKKKSQLLQLVDSRFFVDFAVDFSSDFSGEMEEFVQNGLKIFKKFRRSQQSTSWPIRDPATVYFFRESWPTVDFSKKNPATVDLSSNVDCRLQCLSLASCTWACIWCMNGMTWCVHAGKGRAYWYLWIVSVWIGTYFNCAWRHGVRGESLQACTQACVQYNMEQQVAGKGRPQLMNVYCERRGAESGSVASAVCRWYIAERRIAGGGRPVPRMVIYCKGRGDGWGPLQPAVPNDIVQSNGLQDGRASHSI
jgi:hypothetical protein